MTVETLTFRLAQPSDAADLAIIHEEAWRLAYQGIIPHLALDRMIAKRGPRWWKSYIERGNEVCLLVFGAAPRGYATYGLARGSWPYPMGEIYELYITPIYQGLGFGRRLFADVKVRLGRRGLKRLVVWALEDNENACAFYAALGGKRDIASPERFGDVTLSRRAFLWDTVSASRPK